MPSQPATVPAASCLYEIYSVRQHLTRDGRAHDSQNVLQSVPDSIRHDRKRQRVARLNARDHKIYLDTHNPSVTLSGLHANSGKYNFFIKMRFFDRWLKQEKTPSPDMVRQQPTPSEVATPDIEPLDVGGDPWTVYVFASREDAEEHARVCAEKSQDEMTKTREFDVRSPDALYPFFLSPPLAHIYSGAWFSVLRVRVLHKNAAMYVLL